MSASGTLTTVAVSASVKVPPQETLTAALTIAAAETFNGIVALQRSLNFGQTWEDIIHPTTGEPQRFDGTDAQLTAGPVASFTIRNETRSHMLVRAAMLDAGDEDGVSYALTEVADDVLETVLSDSKGRPLIQVLDNGGIRLTGKAIVVGALEALAGVQSGAAGAVTEHVDEVLISAAAIIATTAGGFGHAQGVPLVAAPGADKAVELVSAVVVNDRDTAAYTAGGNTTINIGGGGAAVTGLVSAANFLGAAVDTRHLFLPLAAAANALTANAGLNLVTATAFTNPGTAAGVVRVRIRYRVHTLGLA
jgi:hypothetical protein